jgi:hypothetical protein
MFAITMDSLRDSQLYKNHIGHRLRQIVLHGKALVAAAALLLKAPQQDEDGAWN